MFERTAKRLTLTVKNAKYAFTARPTDLNITPERLKGPNENYQKFVVLAHARSGSSMVIGTLSKHPQVLCFGEAFARHRMSFYVEGYDNNSAKLMYLRNRHPVEFLEKSIFPSYREDIRAVGFKLFPDQLDSRRLHGVWEWLVSEPKLKIILLQRQNLLAAYVSLLIAIKTGTFGIKSNAQRTNVTVAINFKRCLREFEKRKNYHEDLIRRLKDHEVLEVSYEDMTNDLSEHFIRFQKFLGVDPRPLHIETMKKEIRPLSDTITNYESLRRKFSGTEWSYLFDELAN